MNSNCLPQNRLWSLNGEPLVLLWPHRSLRDRDDKLRRTPFISSWPSCDGSFDIADIPSDNCLPQKSKDCLPQRRFNCLTQSRNDCLPQRRNNCLPQKWQTLTNSSRSCEESLLTRSLMSRSSFGEQGPQKCEPRFAQQSPVRKP